jgi:preprotein translocase subunit YajC
MQALIVLTLSFGLLWVLFLLPQKRQMREHQQLVASLNEGDEVILSAGIHGRITELGAEELLLEVAPGVELRVARQAVLRRVELAVPSADPGAPDETAADAEIDADPGPDELDSEPSPPTSSDGTAQSPAAEPSDSPARDLHA